MCQEYGGYVDGCPRSIENHFWATKTSSIASCLKQDSNTPADIFVCKARSILAPFTTGMLTEKIQLDIIYGLLNRKIREKVPRDKIKTSIELSTNSILLETFERSESVVVEDSRKRVRSQYYRSSGHSEVECRKLLSKQSKDAEKPKIGARAQEVIRESNIPSKRHPPSSSLNSALSCSVSRANVSFPLLCYVCGKSGYIRSNCPTCTVVESSSVEFLSLHTLVSTIHNACRHLRSSWPRSW
ncbi:hypothetical protein JTB14_011896 [Gonioctena quinquepunctata]|nr:hypothetical protein JTB14_011896 [Gonioctena quinquepunctata]